MKFLLYITFLLMLLACQREKVSDVGVGYNKTLLIPPTNDLPTPGTSQNTSENSKSSSPLVQSILDQTEATNADPAIIKKIDEDSGYSTDEGLFNKLFNSKK
jgi:hypothetical protein